MRYLFISLLIIIYTWWSYNSIKELMKSRDDVYYNNDCSTVVYVIFSVFFFSGLFMSGVLKEFIIYYW